MISSGDIAIGVSNLSKMFKVYSRPGDMFWDLVSGKPRHTEYWALRNVSFNVRRGQVVGIVGRNGAGKSTLLKIIAGTLDRTSGSTVVNGRVSAILELGTGFHPEFTGRENIYVGGLCLGMSRDEIDRKLESIIGFSELADVIDRPFKTYSSGMQARLTFATAVSVDPDILIIDEALSVGDAKFQRKCFARIDEFRQQNKTILVVSHTANTITSFCDVAILLEQGTVLEIGEPGFVMKAYLKMLFGGDSESIGLGVEPEIKSSPTAKKEPEPAAGSVQDPLPSSVISMSPAAASHNLVEMRFGTRQAEIVDFGILDASGRKVEVLESGKDYTIFQRMIFHDHITKPSIGFVIRDVKGVDLFGITNGTQKVQIADQRKGAALVAYLKLTMWLSAGDYFLTLGVAREDAIQCDLRNDLYHFKVVGPGNIFTTAVVNLDAKLSVSEECISGSRQSETSSPQLSGAVS